MEPSLGALPLYKSIAESNLNTGADAHEHKILFGNLPENGPESC